MLSRPSPAGVTFPRSAQAGERALGAVSAYLGADGVVRLDFLLPGGAVASPAVLAELVCGLESCLEAMRNDRGSLTVRGVLAGH